MQLTKCLLVSAQIAFAAVFASPGWCWLFDAGPPHKAGAMVRDGSNVVAAAAPFVVEHDSYLTHVGAAIGRAFGPADTGFRVYLTSVLGDVYDLPETAMAEWLLIPDTASLEYYYTHECPGIFLQGGRIYYITFVPATQDFWGAVSWCVTGFYGRGTADYGNEWQYLQYPLCIRVGGSVVPEPSVVTMVGFGLFGAAGGRVTRGLTCRPRWKTRPHESPPAVYRA